MVSSILTNNGALTALQSLKSTQKNLLNTQNRISTGLKVATAKDNAATWAVATAMRSDIANTKQVSENLSVSSSIVATAQTAAEQITDLVKQIRTKVTSAQNPAVDKAQVQADIDGYIGTISSIVSAASFKGVNLIDSAGSQNVLTSVNSVNGVSTASYTALSKQNLSVEEGSMLSGLKDLTVLSRADQTLANLNDGVTKVELTTGAGIDLKAGNKLTINYIDETNTNRTLTVKLNKDLSTVENLVSYLNADSGFSAMFTAEKGGTNGEVLTLSAKNRDSQVRLGKLDAATQLVDTTGVITADTDTVAPVTNPWDTAGTPTVTGASMDGGANKVDMTFADKPLQLGDEFVLKVQGDAPSLDDDGVVTYKLKVMGGDFKTGDKVQDGSNVDKEVYVIAIAASDVTNPNVTGLDIANIMEKALTDGSTAWAPAAGSIAGTAAAGVYGVDVDTNTGKLTITSDAATAADNVLSFNSSKTDYDTLLSKLDTATANAANAAAAFGTAATRIDMQKDFLDKLADTLTTGLGALVDADMSEEAARLQALQVQEQLGTQALSIANQAPQSILSLFR